MTPERIFILRRQYLAECRRLRHQSKVNNKSAKLRGNEVEPRKMPVTKESDEEFSPEVCI
jgi:hypothetical protein